MNLALCRGEWTSHFGVMMDVRWMGCSCISRYILLWCHMVRTPVDTFFMSLNSRTKWKGKGGIVGKEAEETRKSQTAICILFYSSIYCLWLNKARPLFICLLHSLYFWGVFFFYSHTSLHFILSQEHTQMQDNWLVVHQKGFVLFFLFFFGPEKNLKEDWGHMSTEKATSTKVGQSNMWPSCQYKQGELVETSYLRSFGVRVGLCGLNPLMLIIHQRSNEGWDGKNGSGRFRVA